MDTPMQQDTHDARVLPGPSSWRSAAVTSAIAALESGRQTRWMRGVLAANALGAGGSGLLMLAAPRAAGRALFGRTRQDPLVLGTLGAVWLGLGLVSALGVRSPRPLAGLLAAQSVSKGAWLLSVLPRMLRAHERRALPMAGLFAAWELAALRATPWRTLLGGPGRLLPGRA